MTDWDAGRATTALDADDARTRATAREGKRDRLARLLAVLRRPPGERRGGDPAGRDRPPHGDVEADRSTATCARSRASCRSRSGARAAGGASSRARSCRRSG